MWKKMPTAISHPLRWTLIASFLVGLITNTVAATAISGPFPRVGLVPLAISALLAVLFLNTTRLVGSDKPGNRSIYSGIFAIVFFNDIVAAISLSVILILTWDGLGPHWEYRDRSQIWLAVYATAPMIFSLLVHLYLSSLMLFSFLNISSRRAIAFDSLPRTCFQDLESQRPYFYHYFFRQEKYKPVEVEEQNRFRDYEHVGALHKSQRETC